MRIAHFGTFDVENYGDLLFPLILERRLRDVCEEFVHISPAGSEPLWGDCIETVGFEEFAREAEDVSVGGVVLGGGQIFRASHTPLATYDRGGVSSFTAYPSLWLGAAYIAAMKDIPLCWNAPGVAEVLPPVASQLAQWTSSVTDYPTVRDETSRFRLEEAQVQREISVIPDTAIEVARLWTEEEISEAYAEAFSVRKREVPENTVAFHVNRRWLDEEISSVASRVDRISAELDATPIMIAIGPCHGDDEVQRQVACQMGTRPLLIERPRSLREVAACIARSVAYLGSSLHGMITAVSFGSPGLLVAGTEDPKYGGVLEQLGLLSRQTRSWAEAEERARELLASPGEAFELALETAKQDLEGHWERVRETLTACETREDDDKRVALERLPQITESSFGRVEPFVGLLAEHLQTTQTRVKTEIQRRRELRGQLNAESQLLREERQKVHRLAREKGELQQKNRREREDVERLIYWIEELERDVSVLRHSRRWRISQILGKLSSRSPGDPEKREITERLDETFERFRAWSYKRRDTES